VQMRLQDGFAYSLLRNPVLFILQTGSLNARLLLPEGNISPSQSKLEGFKAKLFLDKGKIFYFV